MTLVHQPIELWNADGSNRQLPPTALGEVLRFVQPAVVGATRMAVEGRSTVRGRRPGWLDEVSDIRLEDIEILEDRTRLHFVAPTLGKAAPQLYEQQEFWATRPSSLATALDLFADLLEDVARDDPDSTGFDTALLKGIARFDAGLNETYRCLTLSRHVGAKAPVRLDRKVLERVNRLREAIPDPRPVRVAGTLDMIRASTQTFSLLLDDGTEVRGSVAVADLDIGELTAYFKRRVLVHAKAVYRPSGRLLRLDAEHFEDGRDAPSLWSRVPDPLRTAAEVPRSSVVSTRPRGVAAFFGTWPGDESEAELLEALSELG